MESKELRQRYGRQIAVPEIGMSGQKKISSSKVMVVGCGALGSMVAMQLAGAGVGVIGIADFDNVDISNLQRQFFFTSAESGESKSKILKKRIKELNPEVEVKEYQEMITSKKSEEIFKEYDFIVDATDNPESKRMTGEVTFKLSKPCCIGGVRDFEGMVMTFLPDNSRFEDFFGNASSDGFLPCSMSGVMGPAASLVASVQASETLKYLSNTGSLLSGQLLVFNLLTNNFRKFTL